MDLEDVVKVASPCRVPWSSMSGDERIKHCRQCKLDVYNLSSMSKDEALDFLAAAEGRDRTCISFYRRSDGTIITSDCPKGVARLKNLGTRLLRLVSGLLSVCLAIAPVWADEKDREQDRPGGTRKLPAVSLEDFVKNADSGAEMIYGEYVPGSETGKALPSEGKPEGKPAPKNGQGTEKTPGQKLEKKTVKKARKKPANTTRAGKRLDGAGKRTGATDETSEKPAGK